jgi:phage protein D
VEALIVPSPTFVLTYNGRDITADLTPYQLSVTYTDNLAGTESDSLDLHLEDADGRWCDAWFPTKGDRINLRMGYEGRPLVDCGDFDIDEIELDGPPDQVRIRALAASVMKELRTAQGKAYEKTTLAGIVRTVAARHKLNVVGEIEPIAIERVTQLQQDDLKFLKRLATEYGYAFNVRGDKLTFHRLDALREAEPILTLARTDMARYTFRDRVKDMPKKAKVSHHKADSKQVVAYETDSDGKVVAKPSADTLKLNTRAESPAQAQAKSKAALHRAQDEATTATISMEGDPRLVAGVAIGITTFGKLDGNYQIAASRHELSRASGYTTELELKRTKLGAKTDAKSKLKVATLENGKVVLK